MKFLSEMLKLKSVRYLFWNAEVRFQYYINHCRFRLGCSEISKQSKKKKKKETVPKRKKKLTALDVSLLCLSYTPVKVDLRNN